MNGGRGASAAVQGLSGGRAWGVGLMGLGGVLGALLVLWLVSQLASGLLNAGGLVLWLVSVAVLVLPAVAGGYYLWQRGAVEQRESARFEARRAVLEGDALFRQQAADDLRAQAGRLDAASGGEHLAARLRELAASVDRVRRDEVAWYESNPLSDTELPTLRRHEDALQAESDRLAELSGRLARGDGAASDELMATMDRWERAFRRREALLVRGRRGSDVAPEELLRARTPSRGVAALSALRVGDAVTVDFEDYLVHAVLNYFADGRTWHVWLLRDGDSERSLYGAPGGLQWAVLDKTAAPPDVGARSVTSEGIELALAEAGRATVDIQSAAGDQRGIPVEYWRYTGDDRQVALVERWPNETRALQGRETVADTIDVWPQSATPSA